MKMIKARFYIGLIQADGKPCHIPEVRAEVEKRFAGFTVEKVEGYWRGQPEPSMVVEILGGPEEWGKLMELGRALRDVGKQEEVWMTSEEVEVEVFGEEYEGEDPEVYYGKPWEFEGDLDVEGESNINDEIEAWR